MKKKIKDTRPSVEILGVKVPLHNIYYDATKRLIGGWVSYRFKFTASLPPVPRCPRCGLRSTAMRIRNIEVPK